VEGKAHISSDGFRRRDQIDQSIFAIRALSTDFSDFATVGLLRLSMHFDGKGPAF
jgi:hypothetical protein